MRAGVTGLWAMRTPSGCRASSIADTTAAAAGMVPTSPAPLAPSGLSGDGVCMKRVSNIGNAGAVGMSINGKSFPATAPVRAHLGDWIEVHYTNAGTQAHPMHLHGVPQLVIAKDGYPLPQPYRADTVNVAPGERYTVLIHATVKGNWAWHCHIFPHSEGSQGMFGLFTELIVT